ncbi:30S ribosomal protein S14 [Candidatus Woesearchaeota archaeon]|nr:30S ribosomal protein S14 [Nanoarchaeota archaeon]MCB9369979.1 30S ribosomal protein S14 [Candidatus Woesearchaeota archaeon]USN44515.1 MAG: 30S ribosomal protein S14 [Candidatus Woesearchaeota archaeon]
MTSKDYSKVKAQLENKPAKWEKVQKHNAPKERAFGKGVTRCELCGTSRGVIVKYHLKICRRCFRLNAPKLGFKKLH